ncbi:MAG: DUF5686 and carboxypeptidase regulatory-like domain-containing protein [Bacteroidia bacterium]
MNNKILTAVIFLLFNTIASATILTGKITDNNKQPLPFVNVFVKGTTNGTSANVEGKYRLDLKPGSYMVVFKIIGYKQIEKQVEISTATYTLDVSMEPEHYQLKEAVVKAGEDPAYEIIRQAINKRKFYLNQVNEYSADVYIKGWQRITKHPKKILGQDVDLGEVIDTATGIVYLSESVSKFNFRKPNQVKEIMTSSKVSGRNNSFSFNRASFFLFNFYENILDIDLCPRGAVSPIANNALFFYNYKLVGSFSENGEVVNKIQVIPKRKFDPVFTGFIYIQDNTWRIHSVDLYLSKDNQLQFVDTFSVHQVMLPVEGNNEVWMPVSNQFYYYFNIFGFAGDGVYMGIASNYNVNPNFPKGYFDGEVVKIEEGSNKKDSTYWSAVRPVPLTQVETTDYVRKDSLQVIKESKPYLDSLDKKNNKFKAGELLLGGYGYSNRYKKYNWNVSSLLENIQYNTIEGLNIGAKFDFYKRYEKPNRRLNTGVALRYAFEIEKVYGQANFNYLYNQKKSASLGAVAGYDAVQFNSGNPISPLINTAYTLIAEQNFMKLYQKTFLQINYRRELINGLMFNTNIEYADRQSLTNQTLCTWVNVKDREFTSNDPQNSASDNFNEEQSQALVFAAGIRFRYKQEFYNDPENHYIIGSKYPVLFLRYKHGFKNLIGSDVNFDFVNVGLEDEFSFGLFGRLKYHLGYGNFLNSKSLYFMDYKHFNGNQTIFSNFQLTNYNILPYYTYSTTSEFYEAHLEHNFGGLFFNKIPLLRKAFFNEIVGFHYLHTIGSTDHFEFSAGVEKLSVIRFDFVSSVAKGFKPVTGIRIGFKLDSFGD